jgi:hypothetical protein
MPQKHEDRAGPLCVYPILVNYNPVTAGINAKRRQPSDEAMKMLANSASRVLVAKTSTPASAGGKPPKTEREKRGRLHRQLCGEGILEKSTEQINYRIYRCEEACQENSARIFRKSAWRFP